MLVLDKLELHKQNLDRREEFDKVYMDIAYTVSSLSRARRMKVGAVAVKDGNILSFGYNGTPTGQCNNCEHEVDGELVTVPSVLHAESNALTKMLRNGNSSVGSTMYITHSPCFDCSKLLVQSGVTRVVYVDQYRIVDGLYLLGDCKITVDQIDRDTGVILESWN